jgi:hypothetical protein
MSSKDDTQIQTQSAKRRTWTKPNQAHDRQRGVGAEVHVRFIQHAHNGWKNRAITTLGKRFGHRATAGEGGFRTAAPRTRAMQNRMDGAHARIHDGTAGRTELP